MRRFYSLRGFRRVFTDAGFEVVKAFPFGDLQTRTDRALCYGLQYAAYREIQDAFTWPQGIACHGWVRHLPPSRGHA